MERAIVRFKKAIAFGRSAFGAGEAAKLEGAHARLLERTGDVEITGWIPESNVKKEQAAPPAEPPARGRR